MDEVRISATPLGGAGEVGKSSTLVAHGRDLLLLDAGVMFPEEDMHGVDLVIPDFSYVVSHADRLRAILVTHGHEDHIGALPYFLSQLGQRVPIFATKLTQGLISVKLQEHRVEDLAEFHIAEPGKLYRLGSFEVEFYHVTHSVPDSAGLAIHSPAGTLVYTGDFKFDRTPVDGWPSDIERLRELGDRGVLALLSDCVRVEMPGWTPSERVVGETLEEIIAHAPARVILTTFASNIIRMQQTIRIAHSLGKKVAVAGRSMEENLKVADDLGYLDIPAGAVITLDDARRLPAQRVVLLTTGSQGEPTSVLSRIAADDYRPIRISKGDIVILAATPVPGNEETVAHTVDNLFRLGAKVIYGPLGRTVHVSGHASREELRLMLELVRPRFVAPIHGEYRHQVLYRDLALETGVPSENILIPEVGDVMEFRPERAQISGRIPSGSVLVDGLTVGTVTQVVLRDRRRLAADGILIASLAVDRKTGKLISGPDIISRGFVGADEEKLLDQAKSKVRRALARRPRGEVEHGYLVSKTKEVIGEFIYRETKLRPMILPVVTEV